jgi:hypothetical protein
MARMRTIKPGFFTNEELCELEPLARILFAGLWCWADREGRLEDRPRRIKKEILGYDDGDVESLLGALVARGFIARYAAAGGRYIQVVNFARHQNPHVREAPSAIPAPGERPDGTGPAPGQNSAEPGAEHQPSRAGHGVWGVGHESWGAGLAAGAPPRARSGPRAGARASGRRESVKEQLERVLGPSE